MNCKQHSKLVFNFFFLRQVAFSDESTFQCGTRRSSRQWQAPTLPRPEAGIVKHPTKVMVWGIFSFYGAGRLHVCEGIMNAAKYREVLEKRALPQMHEWFSNNSGIFMQDGAPCHTANVIQAYLAGENQTVLPWPGNSPDLNPIENLWAIIKRKIMKENITTKQQLIAAVIRHWYRNTTLIATLENLITSMPRRIKAVIAAKGGNTKY